MKRTMIGLVLVGLLLIFASCNGDPISEPYVPSNPLPANELKVGSHDPLFIHFALNNKEELADSGGVENYLSVYGNMEYEHLETMYEYTSNGSRAIMTLYFRSKTVFESGTYHFSKEDKVGVLFGGDVAYYPVWNPKVENEKNEYYNIESGTLYIDVNAGDYTIRFDGLVENGVAVKLYYYGDKVYLQEPQ